MNNVLFEIGFDREDVEDIMQLINHNEILNLERKIELFKHYGCSNEFIREVLISRIAIFKMEEEKLNYIFDAIRANNDIIEETILDIL